MITDRLKEVKRLEQLETIRKIKTAQEAIESEVGVHGYYPFNGGQITLTELYKRAGVGHSTLKNAGHKEFFVTVRAWKVRMRAKVAILEYPERRAPRSGKIICEDQIQALQQLNAFKIMYAETIKKLTDSEAENVRLRQMLRDRGLRDAI